MRKRGGAKPDQGPACLGPHPGRALIQEYERDFTRTNACSTPREKTPAEDENERQGNETEARALTQIARFGILFAI